MHEQSIYDDDQTAYQLLLASSSASRASVLKKLQLPFEQISPEIDETQQPNESATDLVQRLSINKALAGLEAYLTQQGHQNAAKKPLITIGSDQIALCGDAILGKPGNRDNAIAQLTKLSGQDVTFYTGIALVTLGQTPSYRLDTTKITMRELSEEQIIRYIDLEQPFHAAGSFHSEALGISLFAKLSTTDPNALIGLPLIELCTLLAQHNINPLQSAR